MLSIGLSALHAKPDSLLQMARHFPVPVAGAELRAIAGGAGDYLWLATRRGLFRFDGEHYDRVLDASVETVAVTSDGWVWAGGPGGLVAVRRGVTRRMLREAVRSVVGRGREIVVLAGRMWQGSIEGLSPVSVNGHGLLAVDRINASGSDVERECVP